jgi:hypothetical protein
MAISILRRFFGSTFHQDWILDHATYQEAVAGFKNRAGADFVRRVSEQLAAELEANPGGSGTIDRQGGNLIGASLDLTDAALLNDILRLLMEPSRHDAM